MIHIFENTLTFFLKISMGPDLTPVIVFSRGVQIRCLFGERGKNEKVDLTQSGYPQKHVSWENQKFEKRNSPNDPNSSDLDSLHPADFRGVFRFFRRQFLKKLEHFENGSRKPKIPKNLASQTVN
jgi:hypothetical protein